MINDSRKIIAITENKNESEITSDQSMNIITNPNQWVKFPSDDTQSSSLTNSVEISIRTSSELETARLLPNNTSIQKSDNENDQTARCCCGLFSRVNYRKLEKKFSEFSRDVIEPLGKIKFKEVLNLKNLIRYFNR